MKHPFKYIRFTLFICFIFLISACNEQKFEASDNQNQVEIDVEAVLYGYFEESDSSLEIADSTASLTAQSKKYSESNSDRFAKNNKLYKYRGSRNSHTKHLLMGRWDSQCRYKGGNEFIKEIIKFRGNNKKMYRFYLNATNENCSNPHYIVAHKIKLDIDDFTELSSQSGTKIDMEIEKTVIGIYSTEAIKTLSEVCQRKFVLKRRQKMNGVNCGEFISFPERGEIFFDIMRVVDGALTFGSHTDETNESKRATEFAQYSFTRLIN